MAGQEFQLSSSGSRSKPIPLTSSLHPSSAKAWSLLYGQERSYSGKQASDVNTQLCHTTFHTRTQGPRSVKDGTKRMTEAELSDKTQDNRSWRTSAAAANRQQFLSKLPRLQEVAGGAGPLRFCLFQLELVRSGGHSPSGRAPLPRAQKGTEARGESCLWLGGRRAAQQASRPGC